MNTTRFHVFRFGLLSLALGAALLGSARGDGQAEQFPPGAKLVRIEAFPAEIHLKTPFDYAQILLTGRLDTGERIDVTRIAKLDEAPAAVSLSPTLRARPAADGEGALRFSLGGQAVAVPVRVSGQKEKHQVSFVRDVMPVMSKVGCNAGTCHGAAQGRNGFQLSLRGYDPLFDHRALTDDVYGRRFNRAAPDQSLMLLKPSGGVPHVGGVLFQPGEPYYELLRLWIAEGVQLDRDGPRVAKIEVLPGSPVLPLPGMKQQLVVIATHTDGTTRDATAEAFLESSNPEVVKVDANGIVTAVRRGETAVTARYAGAYSAATLVIMGDRTGFAWNPVPEYNYIDTLVYDKLKRVRVLPSAVCTDTEFVRRIYLDLIGLPPQPEDVRAFLADETPSKLKRDALVNRLIGSPDYVEHWTNKWADLLQVNRAFLGEPGARALRDWIKTAVAENMPYDRFARELLTASGSNVENPPAAYFKILRDPAAAMENTTHLFLGVRFNCNKCHDHPFERWTQNNYYELAAYFAQVTLTPDLKYKGQQLPGSDVRKAVPLVETVADGKSGEVKHERTGEIAKPAFPFLHGDLAPADAPRRGQLAQWITSKENPYFAKSYVNRLWSYLLGTGLIEPVDDLRAGNPPTNPALLDRLTHDFIKGGYNVQELIKTICKSRTYQHGVVTNDWNKDDEVNYSHAIARRLPAEVLYDAIHRAAGARSRLPGLPEGARAAQLLDAGAKAPGGFLELLGRPPRESACECERSSGMLLGPVLSLVSGPVLQDALKDPNNRIAKLVATERDNARLVEELFLAILSRPPTRAELVTSLTAFEGADDELRKLSEERAGRADALARHEKQLDARQPEWERQVKKIPLWVVLEPEKFQSSGGATLKKMPDNSILASGKNSNPEVYTISAKTDLVGITAVRLEALADKSFPANGPGRAPNGNFVLTDFKAALAPPDDADQAKPLAFRKAIATFSQDTFPVPNAIDNDAKSGWAIAPQFGRTHTAVFETKDRVGLEGGTVLTFTLTHQNANKQHSIGRVRLSVTTMSPPVPLETLPDAVAKIVHMPPKQRSNADRTALKNYFRSLDAELGRLQRRLNELTVPADARTLAAQDLSWAMMNSPAFLFNH